LFADVGNGANIQLGFLVIGKAIFLFALFTKLSQGFVTVIGIVNLFNKFQGLI